MCSLRHKCYFIHLTFKASALISHQYQSREYHQHSKTLILFLLSHSGIDFYALNPRLTTKPNYTRLIDWLILLQFSLVDSRFMGLPMMASCPGTEAAKHSHNIFNCSFCGTLCSLYSTCNNLFLSINQAWWWQQCIWGKYEIREYSSWLVVPHCFSLYFIFTSLSVMVEL